MAKGPIDIGKFNLSSMFEQLGKGKEIFDKIAGGISKVGNVGMQTLKVGGEMLKGSLGKFHLMAANAILDLGNQIKNTFGKFVADFAPGNFEVFNNTLRDISATIGEAVLPLFNAFNEMFRWIGDTIASITPIFRQLIVEGIETLRPALESLGEAIQSLFTSSMMEMMKQRFEMGVKVLKMLMGVFESLFLKIQPLLEILRVALMPVMLALQAILMPFMIQMEIMNQVTRELMKPLNELITLFSDIATEIFESITDLMDGIKEDIMDMAKVAIDAMKQFTDYVREVFDYIRSLLGVSRMELKGSSFGKAAGQGSTTTISSLLSKMDAAAFGAAQSHAEQTANNTRDSVNYLAMISQAVATGAQWTERVAERVLEVREQMLGFVDKVAPSAENFGAIGLIQREAMRKVKEVVG